MTPVRVTLPFPPSVNGIFANTGRWQVAGGKATRAKHGRVITKRYAAWRRESELTMLAARTPKLAEPVRINVVLHASNSRVADADNYLKPILDCCVRMQVIPDDNAKWVRGISVEWGERRRPGAAVVTITPVGDGSG